MAYEFTKQKLALERKLQQKRQFRQLMFGAVGIVVGVALSAAFGHISTLFGLLRATLIAAGVGVFLFYVFDC